MFAAIPALQASAAGPFCLLNSTQAGLLASPALQASASAYMATQFRHSDTAA